MSDDDSTDLDFKPPELDELARLLPAYEMQHFIAKGGMGAVYMACQKSLDREVAIKVLPRHFGDDETFRASFESEAKSMAKLNHPNLISIYDFGQVDGLLYIIMEIVQGKSLYHSAYGKTIDPKEAARITIEICKGLSNAHKHGILHRDIKPANILLDPQASPKIGDFGLARPVGDTENQLAFGTPGYSAPEVIHNPKAVDESTDLYSVGVILYELLTGHLPEKSYSPAASEVDCDPGYDRIIRKATHPTPALRYRDADAMAQDLEKVMNQKEQTNSLLLSPDSKPTQVTKRTLLVSEKANTQSGSASKKTLLVKEKAESRTSLVTTKKTLVTSESGTSKTSDAKSINTSATQLPPSADANVNLVRNIIIIVALLGAIAIAWQGYKSLKASREAQQAAIDKKRAELKAQADAERKRKKAEARKNKGPVRPQRTTSSKPKHLQPKEDTPMETLAKLKSSLRRGERNEMPKSSIISDSRARFFISTPMTWHEALQFCEEYGGHLAIFPETRDLGSFATHIKPEVSVWLGAGTSGHREWCWIDGTPWKHDIRNTSKSAYVSVDDTGIMIPKSPNTQLPFFIEWMMDGSQPATLEQQLKRCADSIQSGNPTYPAGTTRYENRHYLYISRSSDWTTARNHAETARGTLGTPSNPDENIWMSSFINEKLTTNQACWIGGIHPTNDAWQWCTGEPWKFANWRKGAPNEKFNQQLGCAITSSGKWDDFSSDTLLNAFLIEWSKDAENIDPAETNEVHTGNPTAKLKNKCVRILGDIKKTYDKQFETNIKGYEQELSVYKRSLVMSHQRALAPFILAMQSNYQDGRIPNNIPRAGMPRKLRSILESRLDKQNRIQTEYTAKVENVRIKYRANLTSISQHLNSQGLTSRLKKVQHELSSTNSNTQNFVRYILGDS